MQLFRATLMIVVVMTSVAENDPAEVVQQLTKELKKMNFDHLVEVQNFKCKHPQPRLIPAEDLFNVRPNELYTPRATVLHRCGEDTGCCPRDDMICVPDQTEEVTLIFNVHEIVEHKKSRPELRVTNHTLCSCQVVSKDK